jgi:excisionase family DNA binding protein
MLKWTHEGVLPYIQFGQDFLYDRNDLDAFIEQPRKYQYS